MENNHRMCEGCSKCCEYIALEIDEPIDFEDFENIRWYLLHKNVKVYFTEDEDVEVGEDERFKWFLQFQTPCKELNPDGLCQIYEKRPLICQEHSAETCEIRDGDDEEIKSFTNPDEFWAWVEENYDLKPNDETETFKNEEHL